jgi:DNA-binding SARP family transcriptional activator
MKGRGQGSICGDTESISVRLLGELRVSVGSRVIENTQWRLKKPATLVKLLALAPHHRLKREQIMELLWIVPQRQRLRLAVDLPLHRFFTSKARYNDTPIL